MTDEQRKLVEDNHNLIYSFLRKRGFDIEKWYDVAAIGMCKAAITFDKDVSAFSTYAYTFMRNEVLNELRKENFMCTIPENALVYYNAICTFDNEHEFLDILPSSVDVEAEVIQKISVENYLSRLSEKDRLIVEMLSLGRTQKEVADVFGCAHQNISEIKLRLRKRTKLEED